jgi:hypothetical protein
MRWSETPSTGRDIVNNIQTSAPAVSGGPAGSGPPDDTLRDIRERARHLFRYNRVAHPGGRRIAANISPQA